jgi:hypothetical protein
MFSRCFHWFPGPLAPSERIAAFIRANRDNLQDELSDDAACLFVRNSVKVGVLQVIVPGTRTLVPVYTVYIYPPSAIQERLDRWRKWITLQKFYAGHHGVGVRYKFSFKCNHCKTVDHPSGLCPHKTAKRGGKQGGDSDDDDELLPLKKEPGPSSAKPPPPPPPPTPGRGKRDEGKGKGRADPPPKRGKAGGRSNKVSAGRAGDAKRRKV